MEKYDRTAKKIIMGKRENKKSREIKKKRELVLISSVEKKYISFPKYPSSPKLTSSFIKFHQMKFPITEENLNV